VRELETKNAGGRKKLMQAIARYLETLNVRAGVTLEPDLDSTGAALTESVIKLQEQRISSIRLIRKQSGGCASGEALRFQFKIQLSKALDGDVLSGLKARVEPIKEGKILGFFGGKITGVKWVGRKLADRLNQDPEISKSLLRCMQIWDEMELETAASSDSEISILGPWFTNPDTIISLYSPGRSYEEQNCVFGYKTADRIAGIIQKIVNG
jgi:hypothetical protein